MTPRQRIEERADALWREIIRARDRVCRNCGGGPERNNMECAHGFSRRYSATRWDPFNGFLLCWKCHVYFTSHDSEWKAKVQQWVGQSEYERLEAQHTKVCRVNVPYLETVIEALKQGERQCLPCQLS